MRTLRTAVVTAAVTAAIVVPATATVAAEQHTDHTSVTAIGTDTPWGP
jgi:hypothetical protein